MSARQNTPSSDTGSDDSDESVEDHLAGTPDEDGPHNVPDDEVIETLTRVRGIGRWSAQMFLMFRLGRPDVLPELDLGIRKAVKQAYGLRSMPGPQRGTKIGGAG